MVLGALAALLEMEGDIKVIAQVRNGREAYDIVNSNEPDVLITDIEMPEMTGLELASRLKGRSPSKVIVVTTFARPGYLRRAIDAVLAGQPAPSEQYPSIGCNIKWKPGNEPGY